MAVNMGDVATWTGVAVSLGISGAALIVSIRAANAAERQATAAEKALPQPPPAVEWEIEHLSNQGYVLRNIGAGTATGVKVDLERAGNVSHLELRDGRVPRQATVKFLLTPTIARMSLPSELWVSWDGQPEPVAVPVPRPR